jgi:hypothetical protein
MEKGSLHPHAQHIPDANLTLLVQKVLGLREAAPLELRLPLELTEDRADALASQISAAQRRVRVKVPALAMKAAAKVLRWKKERPGELRGMTAAGWDRARQIARGGSITVQDLIEINAWHARHRQHTRLSAAHKDQPWRDPGYVGGLGWGGEVMARYATRMVAKYASMAPPAETGPEIPICEMSIYSHKRGVLRQKSPNG